MLKKSFILIGILLICILTFGCSETEKTYDSDFIEDFKQGLMERWELSKELKFNSKQSGEKFVNIELEKLEPYTSKKFEDTKLQEKAIIYVNLLKQQKEALAYYDIDTEKYITLWEEAYAQRATYINDFIKTYNIEFPEEYQTTIKDFASKAKSIEDDKTFKKQIEEMKNNIEFKKIKDEYGYGYYEAIVENITDKTFNLFSVEINLLDTEGIIIDSQYSYVNNFAPGKKAKLEFMTDSQFDKYELSINCF